MCANGKQNTNTGTNVGMSGMAGFFNALVASNVKQISW